MTLELKHDDVRKCRHLLCYLQLYREPQVTGGFPSLKTIKADLWCLIHCLPKQALEQTIELLVIKDVTALMWCPNESSNLWALHLVALFLLQGLVIFHDQLTQLNGPWEISI